jgi:hypothetical protein
LAAAFFFFLSFNSVFPKTCENSCRVLANQFSRLLYENSGSNGFVYNPALMAATEIDLGIVLDPGH